MSLPVSEALKNISGVLIIIVGGFCWIMKRDDGVPNKWFVMALAVLGLTILFSGQFGNKEGSWHIVQNVGYLLVAFLLHWAPRGQKELHQALIASVLGASIAVFASYIDESRSPSELPSVGFASHSNIYLVLSVGIAVTFLLKAVTSKGHAIVASSAVLVCLGFSGLLDSAMGQLTSLIGLIAMLLALAYGFVRSFLLVILLAVGFLSAWTVTSAESMEVLQLLLADRMMLWGYVPELVREHFWFGVGIGEYNEFNAIPGASNHAHSLYLNVFVERGLIGLIGLMGSIALLGVAIQSKSISEECRKVCWFILLFTALMGIFQTTLHLEHGALALTIMALILQKISLHKALKLSLYTFGNKYVPSTRFRIIQFMDLLRMSFDTTISSERVKISNLIGSPNEICFIQKQLPAVHKILIALFFKKAKWVFDYDDAIWEPVDKRWSRYTRFRQRLRFNLITLCSERVFTASAYLAQFSKCPKTSVIPVSTPLHSEFAIGGSKFQDKWERPLVFGWAGKASSSYQLSALKKHISPDLFCETNFIVLSGEPPDLGVSFRFLPFTEENEELFFQLVHIGIVPSTESPFDAGKTPVKALQHFSYGATVLSNPHGAGSEFISTDTGFIYSNDFEEQVALILRNRDLAKEKAMNGYALHSQVHCSQVVAGMLVQSLKSLGE